MTKNKELNFTLGGRFAGRVLAVLMMAIFGVGASGAANVENRFSGAATPFVFGKLAPELVGTWQYRAGGGETDFAGKSRYRSHRNRVYRFAADGAVEYGFVRDTLTIMQCEIKERKYATGTAATEGSVLTIKFNEADFAGSNSCEGGATEEKKVPAETVRLKYRLQTDEVTGARQLCLAEADGETCYNKKD